MLTLIIVLAIVFVCRAHAEKMPELDEAGYRAAVGLHAVRRRLDVALTKAELKSTAAQLRRELRVELEDDADLLRRYREEQP